MSIVVFRTDRLGDVLLSLPSVVWIRNAFPNARVQFVCRPVLLDLLTPFLKRHHIEGVSLTDWPRLISDPVHISIQLNKDTVLSRDLMKRGVEIRVGISSGGLAPHFLSHPVRQHRSQALKNEGEYCLELVEEARCAIDGKSNTVTVGQLQLPVEERRQQEAMEWLEKHQLTEKRFWIVHPGMGGSARNWTAAEYSIAIRHLTKNRFAGRATVLSIGPEAVDKTIAKELSKQVHFDAVLEGLSLVQLAEVFRSALLVLAPSTGPLHLAHWVGSETLGIYSPVKAHLSRRWMPWGAMGKVVVLEPQGFCPARRNCWGRWCPRFDCMASLTQSLVPRNNGPLVNGVNQSWTT